MSPDLPPLIAAARRGVATAQHQLYEAFAAQVFGVCLRYGRDRAEAEDMAQEAWLRAFSKLDRLSDPCAFGGWLRRLTVNECLQYLRRTGLTLEELPPVLPKGHEVRPEAMSALSAQELIEHIQTLPAGYRTVFNLVAIEGFSHAEVAKRLGVTEATSRSQLTRARTLLQRRIAKLATLCP